MFFKYPKRTFRLNIDPYIPIDDILKITNDIPRFDYEQENLTKVKTYFDFNVQNIINHDKKWRKRNVGRMTATLRQAQIPDLQDFTDNYSRDKIFEFDLNRLT